MKRKQSQGISPEELVKARALLEDIRRKLEAKLAASAENANKAGMSRADFRALMQKFLAEVDGQIAMVDDTAAMRARREGSRP